MEKTKSKFDGQVNSQSDILYTSELVEHLKMQIAAYGDAQIHFQANGNDVVLTKFIHEGHALIVDVQENV